MKLKRCRYAIDNIIYQKNRGCKISSGDIDELLTHPGDKECENSYLYYMKSCTCLGSDQYRKAVLYNKKALSLCQNDIGTYELIRDQFISIANAMVNVARFDPANLEIGWVYENLSDFACLGFDHHIFALKHYQVVGESKKERKLARILIDLYPNHPIIEQYSEGKQQYKREVRDEKNKDQEKATTIPRLKAVKKDS